MTHQPPCLLVSPGVPAPVKDALRAQYDCVMAHSAAELEALVTDHASRITLFATTATDGVTEALMARLPKLRAVCSLGVGVDALDLDAARRRGIAVSNTPDVLNDCVADLAVGLLIDVARGLSRGDRLVRRGDWPRTGPGPLGTRVSGRKLGLLGMGRIGQTIARRLSGFDMEIRYHTPQAKAALPYGYEPSLPALAQWCDFLVVACSGGPATRHLVNAEVLSALGAQGYLVNIARGSVVDERALVQALQAQTIAGAALDVFANEPQVPAELTTMEHVVLLPHIASATAQTRRAMGELMLANIQSFVQSGTLKTAAA